MYIKIVRHLEDEQGVSSSKGSLEEKVVPSEHHIFECWEAEYRKVSVSSISEFHELMNKIETARIVTPIAEKDSPFEFIQVRTINVEGDDKYVDETLIGRDCTLFIMNNEGKTIDRMICL